MQGPALELNPSDAIVFVDETGHHKLRDPAHPVFGLAGCVMMVPHYRDVVSDAWRALKRDRFPRLDVVHAAELRDRGVFVQLIREQPFGRFGAVMRRDATQLPDPTAYPGPVPTRVRSGRQVIGPIVSRQIVELLEPLRFRRVVIVIESGGQWAKSLVLTFGNLRVTVDGNSIPVMFAFMPKRAREPGIEIADCLAHAAGVAARDRRFDEEDFRAMFAGPRDRVAFALVEYALRVHRPEEPDGERLVIRSLGSPYTG